MEKRVFHIVPWQVDIGAQVLNSTGGSGLHRPYGTFNAARTGNGRAEWVRLPPEPKSPTACLRQTPSPTPVQNPDGLHLQPLELSGSSVTAKPGSTRHSRVFVSDVGARMEEVQASCIQGAARRSEADMGVARHSRELACNTEEQDAVGNGVLGSAGSHGTGCSSSSSSRPMAEVFTACAGSSNMPSGAGAISNSTQQHASSCSSDAVAGVSGLVVGGKEIHDDTNPSSCSSHTLPTSQPLVPSHLHHHHKHHAGQQQQHMPQGRDSKRPSVVPNEQHAMLQAGQKHQQLQQQRSESLRAPACFKQQPLEGKPFYSPLRWKPEVIKRTPHVSPPPWEQQAGAEQKQLPSSSRLEKSVSEERAVEGLRNSSPKREGWFQLPDATLLGKGGAAAVPAGIRMGHGYYRWEIGLELVMQAFC